MIDLPKYFDLSVEMKKLYISKDYYAPIKRNNNFSNDDYWLESVDPDGNKRNRIDEKEQYISDISAEMDYINKLKPGKILDIGCGLGWLLSAVDDAWEKHGVEISQYASEYATKYANIKNDDFLNVDYDSNFFDLIVMHHVIEHMGNFIEIYDSCNNVISFGNSNNPRQPYTQDRLKEEIQYISTDGLRCLESLGENHL